jgi:hypothetical protein
MARTITITAQSLRYVLPHISDDAHRPTLHSLYVTPDGTITATSGYTLAMHRNAATLDGPAVLLSFIKPKSLTAARVETVTVTIPDGSTQASVTLLDKLGFPCGATFATVEEGPYPETRYLFRRAADVIAEGSPIPAISFDAARAALFDVPKGGPVSMHFDGARAGAVILWPSNPDAIGLLMPCQPIADSLKADGIALARIAAGITEPVPA